MDDLTGAFDVAIVGMAGRFPAARSVRDLWRKLEAGVELVTFFSDEDLAEAGVPAAVLADPDYVKAAPILDEIDTFDAPFFAIAPREAEILDPQQRLFLETAWTALEDAGHVPERFDGAVGVFAGVFMSSYLVSNLLSNGKLLREVGEIAVRHGNEKDYLATRTSYKLDLKGPSFTVQTSCSTSLVAVHLACGSLINRECDMALAGGVSVRVPHRAGYFRDGEGGILAPDGHCRAFDARAGGTLFGQGVAVVALRRLEDAVADGDRIYAVIKGSAINNDGSDKVGYTAPSLDGQSRVIAEALAMADVAPETISCIEAHGTGTPLGDPIEIAALSEAFDLGPEHRGTCAVGAVKSNLGHLSAAAGVTGLIKAALQLHERRLVPSLHFEEPNPKIDFDAGPFFVNTESRPWEPRNGAPLRAGVSSFGMGGTNAHAILEEAPRREPSGASRPVHLLPLSARTEPALERVSDDLVAALEASPEMPLADVAFTLHSGRRRFAHRRVLVARETGTAATALAARDPHRVVTAVEEETERPVVFLFPGQGAQYPNMARGLYETEELFRRELDRCADTLRGPLGLDLRQILFPDADRTDEAEEELRRTALTQPALFTVEYALARLWMSWGVVPRAMIGHSIGEYVAACLAGVFELDDALALVAERGRLMQALPAGTMMAVSLPEEELAPRLGERLSVAAVNAPGTTIVSGEPEAVNALERELKAADPDVKCTFLATSHAFHSPMMDPALEPFRERVAAVTLQAPELQFVSNLTGAPVTAEEATDPDYWVRHLRHAVRFADGLDALLEDPGSVYLELGPGHALTSLVRRQHKTAGTEVTITSLPERPVPGQDGAEARDDQEHLLAALGRFWLVGGQVDWRGFWAGEDRRRVDLPTYPFERQRYWIDARPGAALAGLDAVAPRRALDDWFSMPAWRQARPLRKSPEAPAEGVWIVFADSGGLGDEVAGRLRGAGRRTLVVAPGKGLADRGEDRWEVAPASGDDLDALLATIDSGATLGGIVHLWSLDALSSRGAGSAALELGFYSLLELARALGRQDPEHGTPITVVTAGAHEVIGGDLTSPEQATVAGPVKVIPLEYPGAACAGVDLDPDALDVLEGYGLEGGGPGRVETAALADLVLAEARSLASTQNGGGRTPAERLVAYRGRHRWVEGFEPIVLDTPSGGHPRLRPEGVYLITGGLGGVGLAVAEHLARTLPGVKLALTGRSPVPPPDEWEAIAAGEAGEAGGRAKVGALRRLEAAGAEVLPLSADVADGAAMAAAVAAVRSRFGPVHGVFHGAGVAGRGILQLKERTAAEEVLAPKVRGTRVLEDLFGGSEQGRPLDFFVLFSSATALTGQPGQVDYCAANAFLDAFVHCHRFGPETLVVSANWTSWGEVGMAAEAIRAADGPVAGARPDEVIPPERGLEALERILAEDLSRVVVCPRDLGEMIAERAAFRPGDAMGALDGGDGERPRHPRPVLSTAYVPPNTERERRVAALWESVLGIDQVGIHDSFFELGGNSVTGLQLIARLKRELGAELPVVALYEAPTVESLARRLSGAAGEAGADGAGGEEGAAGDGRPDRQERGARRRERRAARRKQTEEDVVPEESLP